MNHRYVLALALRDLPAEKAGYLSRVADDLDRTPGLEERLHLLYPVLAAAAPAIEPMLDPADCAGMAADFVLEHAEGIAGTLYSAAYLTQGTAALSAWADRFIARLAEAILAGLQAGTITLNERKVWRFRSDDLADPVDAFPFDPDAEDDP